jgi:hypothetical protein
MNRDKTGAFMIEIPEEFQSINLEQILKDEVLKEIKEFHNEQFTSIIMHPDSYKSLMDYQNQNPIQRFLWEIEWGFKDCLDNFTNWKGHMRGEDWDFWEILSGEWSSYE